MIQAKCLGGWMTFKCHPNGGLKSTLSLRFLNPWIAEGSLPANTNQVLEAFVLSKRGQTLKVYDAFPALFKSLSKSRDEMVLAGYLS